MTDEDALMKHDAMEKFFQTALPDPECEPIRFAYYVKLFNFYNKPTEVQNVAPETE